MKRTFWLASLLLLSAPTFANNLPVVYSLESAKTLSSDGNHQNYIQAASFVKKSRAQHYAEFLHSKTHYKIRTLYKDKFYYVLIGPIPEAIDVRATADNILLGSSANLAARYQAPRTAAQPSRAAMIQEASQQTPQADPAIQQPQSNPYEGFEKTAWYASGAGGLVKPSLPSQLIVYNNSGFPGTFGQDIYTLQQNYQGMVEFGAGRRWERTHDWFPAYALGVNYQHFFNKNMGNTITQYSTAEFTNYNYTWDVSADVFLASLKLNVLNFKHFMPYVTGALGCSFNRSGNYTETALPGLTDTRVSAGFQARTNLQFAYNVGVGIDYQVMKNLLVAAEYQYQNLGNMALGNGSGLWAGQSLNLGNYIANTYLLKLTYLVD